MTKGSCAIISFDFGLALTAISDALLAFGVVQPHLKYNPSRLFKHFQVLVKYVASENKKKKKKTDVVEDHHKSPGPTRKDPSGEKSSLVLYNNMTAVYIYM